jgi:hypothetical protein
MNERCAKQKETSEQHARLAEIYGRADPSLSREQVARRSMLARYHAMLAKAALKRAKRNRQFEGRGESDGDQLAFKGF